MMLNPKINIEINSFFPVFLLIGIYVVMNIVTILPIDIEAFKIPKPSLPTFKISCAKTDKIATVPPNKTAIISKVSAPKMALF